MRKYPEYGTAAYAEIKAQKLGTKELDPELEELLDELENVDQPLKPFAKDLKFDSPDPDVQDMDKILARIILQVDQLRKMIEHWVVMNEADHKKQMELLK